MMNRQLKRAQKKQEDRAEKLKAKKKEYKQEKKQRRRSKRAEAKAKGKPAPKPQPVNSKRIPGRFANIMTFVTLFFVSLNAVSPVSQESFWADVLLKAAYYVFLGYFMTLWLARRGTPNPAVTTFAFSVLIGSGLELMKLVFRQPIDPFHIIFAVPAAALGAFFARWLINRQAA